MKNSLTVLRATTAIVVSLSFLGAHAGAGAAELRLAQAQLPTDEQQPPTETKPAGGQSETTSEAQQQPGAEGEATMQSEREGTTASDTETVATPQSPAEGTAKDQGGTTEAQAGVDAAEPKPETDAAAAETQAEGAATTEAQATGKGTTQPTDAATTETQAGAAPAEGVTTTEPQPTAEGTATEAQPQAGTAAEAGAEAAAEAQAAGEAASTEVQPDTATSTEPQTESGAAATETQADSATTESPATTEGHAGTEGQTATESQTATEAQTTTESQATTESEATTEGQAPTESQTATEATPTQPTEQTQGQAEATGTTAGSQTESEAGAAGTHATTTTETQPATGAEATTEAGTAAAAAGAETQAAGEAGVTEAEVEAATASGQDVVIEDSTTNEELESQLEALRQQTADLQQRLEQAEAVSVEEEVVTDATARTSSEEVQAVDKDNNNVWKFLGAAAGGAVVGALIPALGGRLVQDQGDRVIVERGGEFFVHKDENLLLRRPGTRVQTEEFPGGITRTTVHRDDGSSVVTVRNEGGFILRRTRITPDGQEIVLLEQTPQEVYSFNSWDELPPVSAHASDERYVIDYSRADRDRLRQALSAQSFYEGDRSFSLQDVRENERVRALMPRIDLDAINFDTGSAAIKPSEVEELTALGREMAATIEENPREIYLVEGHTDAVGSNLSNLALSDRRAEAVALALTEYFDIPPENLVVQGYGEQFLKEQTEGPSAINRRATVRRITPLLDRVASR